MKNEAASPLLRGVAGIVGVMFCFTGGAIFINAATALWALLNQLHTSSVFTPRDALYVAVWTVFSLSMLIGGVSLLNAAWRARRYNMVPGPTLYVAGASLMIIAFYLLAAAAPMYALVAGVFGAGLLIAEYSSDYV